MLRGLNGWRRFVVGQVQCVGPSIHRPACSILGERAIIHQPPGKLRDQDGQRDTALDVLQIIGNTLFLCRVEHVDFTAMLPAVVEEQGFTAAWVVHDALTVRVHNLAEFLPGFVVHLK